MPNQRKPTRATVERPATKPAATLKVLVVDDDPFQLEFIADTLRGLGVVDITLAGDSAQALQAQTGAGAAAPFDLLVSDLYMPGKDGFQMMGDLADAGYRQALIIVSGQDAKVLHSASLVAQLRRFRLLGTIQKPVTAEAMAELLRKLTG